MFSKQDEEREKKWKEYLSIYTQYVDFYHKELLKNDTYSNAREYLKNRSLGKEEVKKWLKSNILSIDRRNWQQSTALRKDEGYGYAICERRQAENSVKDRS